MKRTMMSILTSLIFILPLTGCSLEPNHQNNTNISTAGNQITNTEKSQGEDLASLPEIEKSATKLLSPYGWTILIQAPAIQYDTLNQSTWTNQFSGFVWNWNESISAEGGLPFRNLTGSEIRLISYRVSRKSSGNNGLLYYATFVVYQRKIHGAWIAQGEAFNTPGVSLEGNIPSDMRNMDAWLRDHSWISPSNAPLKNFVGKRAPTLIKWWFANGKEGSLNKAIQLVDPVYRWVNPHESAKSYWTDFFYNHKNDQIKQVTLEKRLSPPKNEFVGEELYKVAFGSGSSIYITVDKRASDEPWFIESVTKTM